MSDNPAPVPPYWLEPPISWQESPIDWHDDTPSEASRVIAGKPPRGIDAEKFAALADL